MRFEYLRGERIHRVELTELGEGRWRVAWSLRAAGGDEPSESEPLEVRSFELEALPVGPSAYSVREGHSVTELRIERDGSTRTVIEAGRAARFEHLDPYASGGGLGPGHHGGPAEIASPMPGRVVELLVSEGERVEEGATVVVVEAMKMANEYRSPVTGTVTSLRCAPGDAVEGGTVLLVVTPDETED